MHDQRISSTACIPTHNYRYENVLRKGLTVVLLATLATCSALGWLMIDNVDFINSTISPGLSDAWKLSVLNADDLPGDPAETHEFLANLVLGLVIAHLGFLLLFARKPAWMMLAARRRKNAHDDLITLRVRAVHDETVDSRSLSWFPLLPANRCQPIGRASIFTSRCRAATSCCGDVIHSPVRRDWTIACGSQ